VALALTTAFALVVFSNRINSLMEQVISFFYAAKPDSWAGQIFSSIASHASNVSSESYVSKAVRLFDRIERGLLVAGIFFFLTYFGLLINQTALPAFLRNTWKRQHGLGESIAGPIKGLRNSLRPGWLKTWFAEIIGALRNPRLLLAGIALGVATGVRAIAPLAGVIVFLYLFTKIRSRAWTMAIAYFLVAGIVTYLVWPRLWDAPILRYLEGLGIILNFPHHTNRILFNGRLYGDTELPRSYVPILLNLQFTEPFLLSGYIGFAMLGWRLLRSRLRTDLVLYIGLSFFLPLSGLILLESPLYHNFRQALFMIPAMFMLAGPALELVFSKITQNWARVLLIVAIALPGVYSSVKLFPYEYVYYNSLVGGPAGASNRYELDYWRISLREVALELNEIAPSESKILVTHGAGLFVRYSRPDLVVDKVINSILGPSEGFDYVVQVSRWKAWDQYPDAKTVIIIEREGTVLATAKEIR
jgi:hypothetical protein